MPFGLTGAPSTFAQMTADTLGDLVGTLFELFVDDGGMAGDVFETKLANLRTFFNRVRDKGLSLSAAKSQFFMTEAVFAGARIGPDGIKPDFTKLTAIVEWKTPTDLQNLSAFLGLAGYFRSLIKGYATMAQPLTDLIRDLDLPKLKGRSAYNKAMRSHSLEGIWGKPHDRAFLDLKIALTTEPVLKGPKFDGTPFIITTDGCKWGLAGMCSQCFKTVLPNGKEVERIHPIAFTSKRTSTTEEKYKPYLLEFAALKLSLDKFADMIWGFPIEIETDCQALRDTMLNDNPNSTHARWRDGVLAHQIIDIRHKPGKLNKVADGLSRKYTNTPAEPGDGHESTVNEDWEAKTGLANDILQVQTSDSDHTDSLRARFKNEPLFLEVIDAIQEQDHGTSLRRKKRAQHRAKDYFIEDDKLWKVSDGRSVRGEARRECVSQEEAKALAWEVHRNNSHFHRDSIKVELLTRIVSPKLDKSITQAIVECGKCKAFGPTHIHSLLEPITRRHPFELIAADTLTLPLGKGGFSKVCLYVDIFSQFTWGYKLKAATGRTTTTSFNNICDTYTPPETLMVDGGPEFNNKEVREACAKRNTKLHVIPAYSPWINGLVEGTNSRLLAILKRLCAPDLGEDEYDAMDLPKNWPDHLVESIRILNTRILPNLKYSPAELMLGLVVNTSPTPASQTELPVAETEVDVQMAYVNQHRLDGYSQIVEHALNRKDKFDRKLTSRPPGKVVFKAGQLVQIYRNDLDFTFKADRKLEPKWSAPRRVTNRDKNSYQLETLEGLPIGGRFSARRLRRFIPRTGTQLAEEQGKIEEERGIAEEEADRVEVDGADKDERMDGEGESPDGNIEDEERADENSEQGPTDEHNEDSGVGVFWLDFLAT
jgi:transposase InsO family protein